MGDSDDWEDDVKANLFPEGDEAPPVATTQKGRGGGRGRAAAKKGGVGGGRGGGKNKEVRPCGCPSCEEPVKGHSKYCERHNRLYQDMEYQRGQCQDEEACAAYVKAMANDTTAALEVEKFGFDNPGDARYKRKTMLEWCRFKRSYGHRVEQTDKDKAKPYTESAFHIYATQSEGLTPAEAKTWWASFYENPGVVPRESVLREVPLHPAH